MNRRAPLAMLAWALCALTLSAAPQVDAESTSVAGTWEGTLQAGVALRLVLHVRVDGDELTGTVDSPDQGATDIPVDKLRFDDNTLSFSIKAIGASYRAKLKDDVLVGRWRQGGTGLKLDLNRVATPTKVQRPQTPKPPFPYAQTEVAFESVDGTARLAGTLTLPNTDGPFAAVVLVSGSGPQDRDGAVFGHQPFAVIADHLARHDIAVLRFDDRGVGASTGDRAEATIKDFAQDVRGAIALLAKHPRIDQIGIVGHSEGALVADIVATDTARVDWIIRLAGPAVSGRDILMAQSAALFDTSGSDPKALASLLALNGTLYDLAAADTTTHELRSQAMLAIEQARAGMSPVMRKALGLPDDATPMVGTLSTPWFRHFVRHDPGDLLAHLSIPVLAIYGGKDVQVPAQQNRPVAQHLLSHPQSLTRLYANLNHLLQNAPTGSPSEYGALEETIDPTVLDDLVSWIGERVRAAP